MSVDTALKLDRLQKKNIRSDLLFSSVDFYSYFPYRLVIIIVAISFIFESLKNCLHINVNSFMFFLFLGLCYNHLFFFFFYKTI